MSTRRILIVEDHEASRSALRSIFRRQGWEVSEAGTVAEGLALLGVEPPPDCVVLDMDLPDGRGEVVLRAVRERHLPTRVAVCSGMTDDARWDAVKGLDPEALFQKPIDAADMCRACGPV